MPPPGVPKPPVADIAAVTRAVVAGDPESARRLMREHIEAWTRRTTG